MSRTETDMYVCDACGREGGRERPARWEFVSVHVHVETDAGRKVGAVAGVHLCQACYAGNKANVGVLLLKPAQRAQAAALDAFVKDVEAAARRG